MKTTIAIILAFTAFGADAQDIVLPGCLYPQHRRKVTIGSPRSGGTIYIIDDVRVQYISPEEMLIEAKPEIKPLLNTYLPTCFKLDREEIRTMPYMDINDMLSIFPTVYQRQRGVGVSVGGSRNEGMLYILDGMVIM